MTSITLFAASWCGHCQAFEDTWEKIIKWCAGKSIHTEKILDDKLQIMQNDPSQNNTGIPLDMIEGFPTIIIKRSGGDLVKVADRSFDSIIDLLGEKKSDHVQSGGSCSKTGCSLKKQSGGAPMEFEYKKKYLLYKGKYLALKNKLKM